MLTFNIQKIFKIIRSVDKWDIETNSCHLFNTEKDKRWRELTFLSMGTRKVCDTWLCEDTNDGRRDESPCIDSLIRWLVTVKSSLEDRVNNRFEKKQTK